jgi:hypothetical protein
MTTQTRLQRAGIVAAALAMTVAGVSSCGRNDDGAREVDANWAEFCFLATDLLAKTQFSHTPDPTALEAVWNDVSKVFSDMVTAAPLDVAGPVKVLADNWEARKKIFETYNYDITEMASVPKISEELDALTQGADVTDANEKLSAATIARCNVQP